MTSWNRPILTFWFCFISIGLSFTDANAQEEKKLFGVTDDAGNQIEIVLAQWPNQTVECMLRIIDAKGGLLIQEPLVGGLELTGLAVLPLRIWIPELVQGSEETLFEQNVDLEFELITDTSGSGTPPTGPPPNNGSGNSGGTNGANTSTADNSSEE